MPQVKISRGQVFFADVSLGARFFYDGNVYVKTTMVPKPERQRGYSNARDDRDREWAMGQDLLVHPVVEDPVTVTC